MTSKNCYVYFIAWSKLNLWYYGRRTAKNCDPSDLFISYFTSSKYVAQTRKLYGEPDIIQVRRQFGNDQNACINWEDRVLRKMKVSSRIDCLNKTSTAIYDTTGVFPGFSKTGEFVGMIDSADPRKGDTIFAFIHVNEQLREKCKIGAAKRSAAGLGWKTSTGIQASRIAVNAGTHSGLAKNRHPRCTEVQIDLVRAGTHHWQSEEHKIKTSKNTITRLKNKTHKFAEETTCDVCGAKTSVAAHNHHHGKNCHLYPGSKRNIKYENAQYAFAYDTINERQLGKIERKYIVGHLKVSIKGTSVYTNEHGVPERISKSDPRVAEYNLVSCHKNKCCSRMT